MTKNYYIDMDGVLVLYDPDAYTGDDPAYKRKGYHYFRNLPPDRKMLEFIDALHTKCRYTGDNLYILTSLASNGLIFNEQFHDKISWLQKWLPYLPIDNILISVTSKRDVVEYINNHTLSQNDILIDDYNKNLFEWEDAHGIAVKYCNGINNPESFPRWKLRHDSSIDDMFKTLASIN